MWGTFKLLHININSEILKRLGEAKVPVHNAATTVFSTGVKRCETISWVFFLFFFFSLAGQTSPLCYLR